ncbi:MAG: DUF4065 domain-containing protein [Nitrosopumilus sp. B06]|nr:MAG: DUF4065 domain-containing protein [Nitrosopumilus sp. B06]
MIVFKNKNELDYTTHVNIISRTSKTMLGAIWTGDYITALGKGRFTPMQVIKLAYMSHGYTLALTDEPLFSDKVEAWKYGPVISSLYHALKKYRNAPIDSLYACGTRIGSQELDKRTSEIRVTIGDSKAGIIQKVVDMYGDHSALELSGGTHKEGTPWQKVYKKGVQFIEIPNEIIKDYYLKLVKRR